MTNEHQAFEAEKDRKPRRGLKSPANVVGMWLSDPKFWEFVGNAEDRETADFAFKAMWGIASKTALNADPDKWSRVRAWARPYTDTLDQGKKKAVEAAFNQRQEDAPNNEGDSHV